MTKVQKFHSHGHKSPAPIRRKTPSSTRPISPACPLSKSSDDKILTALITYNTQAEAAASLHSTTSSISKFLKLRELNHATICLIKYAENILKKPEEERAPYEHQVLKEYRALYAQKLELSEHSRARSFFESATKIAKDIAAKDIDNENWSQLPGASLDDSSYNPENLYGFFGDTNTTFEDEPNQLILEPLSLQ